MVAPANGWAMSRTWTVVGVIYAQGRMLSVMAHFRCEEMHDMWVIVMASSVLAAGLSLGVC